MYQITKLSDGLAGGWKERMAVYAVWGVKGEGYRIKLALAGPDRDKLIMNQFCDQTTVIEFEGRTEYLPYGKGQWQKYITILFNGGWAAMEAYAAINKTGYEIGGWDFVHKLVDSGVDLVAINTKLESDIAAITKKANELTEADKDPGFIGLAAEVKKQGVVIGKTYKNDPRAITLRLASIVMTGTTRNLPCWFASRVKELPQDVIMLALFHGMREGIQ